MTPDAFGVALLLGLAVVLAWALRYRGRQMVCRRCEQTVTAERRRNGSLGVELVLWGLTFVSFVVGVFALPILLVCALFVISALIYSGWRAGSARWVCSLCEGPDVVPIKSAAGARIAAARAPSAPTEARAPEPQPVEDEAALSADDRAAAERAIAELQRPKRTTPRA